MDVRELLKITSAGIKVFERQEDKVCGPALCALRDCCFCPACAFCGAELRCLSGRRTRCVGLRCARCTERVFSFPLDEVGEVCVYVAAEGQVLCGSSGPCTKPAGQLGTCKCNPLPASGSTGALTQTP